MLVDGKKIGLSKEEVDARKGSIGGSDSNIIMKGGEDAYNLWLVKTGQKEPDNLDDVLAVWMGTWTEALNAAWYEKVTGNKVRQRGERMGKEWMHATVDGVVMVQHLEIFWNTAVWEAKHTGGFEAREKVLSRYWPQLHHNMHCCGLSNAVLSVFEGNSGYWYQDVEMDLAYMNELLEREREFWGCVQSKTWTGEWNPVEATIPTSYREVDMTGSNLWADQAMQWLQHRPAKQAFDKAEKELKGMVAVDVSRAHGHGIEVKRAKNGNLRIGEL